MKHMINTRLTERNEQITLLFGGLFERRMQLSQHFMSFTCRRCTARASTISPLVFVPLAPAPDASDRDNLVPFTNATLQTVLLRHLTFHLCAIPRMDIQSNEGNGDFWCYQAGRGKVQRTIAVEHKRAIWDIKMLNHNFHWERRRLVHGCWHERRISRRTRRWMRMSVKVHGNGRTICESEAFSHHTLGYRAVHKRTISLNQLDAETVETCEYGVDKRAIRRTRQDP